MFLIESSDVAAEFEGSGGDDDIVVVIMLPVEGSCLARTMASASNIIAVCRWVVLVFCGSRGGHDARPQLLPLAIPG